MGNPTKHQFPLNLTRPLADGTAWSLTSHRWIYLVLGFFLVLYGFLTLNGYGNHDDIYRMIGTWRTLVSEHRYAPSRFQGYLIPELSIGLSSQIGDYYLSNAVAALLGLGSLFCFYRLLLPVTAPAIAALAVGAIGSNPFWIIAATTSTDYIYPAFFFLLGLLAMLYGRLRWAGLIFALAVSSRITYAPMVALAFAFYFPYLRSRKERSGRFWQGIALFLVGSAALYLPVFFASGMSLSFLKFASDTKGGTLGDIVRFFYKNVYFWGLPTFIVLLVFFIQERGFFGRQIGRNPFRNATVEKLVFHAVFWWFIYTEIWFLRLPHQYQYLIPILFCVAYFITRISNLRKQIIFLSLIFSLHLVYAVCSFDLLETYQTEGVNNTIHSDGAVFRPSFKKGALLRDYDWRSRYQHHLTNDFNQRWQHFGQPLGNPL
jgi:hypothetical protein